MSSISLQCFTCSTWVSDIHVPLDGLMPYMTNYEYTCVQCGAGQDGEKLIKKPASFIQVGITAIANLMSSAKSDDQIYFDLEQEIYPFVWEHWDCICTKRSKAGSWKSNLHTKLTSETIIFSEKDGKFSLVDQDLSLIGPRRYESKTVPLKVSTKVKRKANDANTTITSNSKKLKQGDTVSSTVKGLSHGYPLEHPYNKDGYRYILAEQDPHSSIVLDDMAGRPIPPEVYRPWMSPTVLLSLHDRAPQIKVSDNRLTVTGDKGYCMLRATHGVSEGTWYYEIHVDELGHDNSALRLGWAQPLATLQAPCGYDKLSYSWRSKKGTIFHQSRGRHYGDGYHTGDTLGFMIHLPSKSKKKLSHPQTYKDQALIKFKNFFYFEEKDTLVEEYEKSLKPNKGSQITFYKNGVPQGVAFTDIFYGTYYPAMSFYKSAIITANFGPDFTFPPTEHHIRPFSEVAEKGAIEQTMSEMLFHVESKVQSRTRAQYPSNYKFSA